MKILHMLCFMLLLSGVNAQCVSDFTSCNSIIDAYLQNKSCSNMWNSNGECLDGSDNWPCLSGVSRQGPVSIGRNDSPVGYGLAISGGLATRYMIIQLCESGGWCDYVFEKDYPLRSLQETKAFITENKHLPDFPPERDILEKGVIEVKEITLLQQVKIEEAFLHIIELQSRIKKISDQ